MKEMLKLLEWILFMSLAIEFLKILSVPWTMVVKKKLAIWKLLELHN